jgi:hypothetical protein
MFFEKIGVMFFQKVRPLFFFSLLIAPILIAASFLFFEYQDMKQLEFRFSRAVRNEKSALEKKKRKEKFLQKHSNAHPYFLNQKVGTLSFLKNERAQIEILCNHPAFPPHHCLKQRLIEIENNKPIFVEENIRNSKKMKESKEKLKFPIQTSEKDLQELLAIIERPTESSPQMVITDFSLKSKKTSLQTNVWEVDMNLIKREFTP